MSHVKITSDGTAAGTTITVDGKPLANAVSLRVDANGDGRVRVFVELLCNEIEVDAEALVETEAAP